VSDLIAYRVWLRRQGGWSRRTEKSLVVLGEAALERQLARKSPIAVWFAPALRHECQVCGRAGHWGEGWIAWARYKERHELRGEGEDIYCSPDCCERENPDLRPASWMSINDEPLPPEQRRLLWRAFRADEDAQLAARNAIRAVPRPEWKGDGWCKWCGLEITDKRRRSWHEDCAKTYLLHSDQGVQLSFLRKRDGWLCAWPGCEQRGCEVDHRVPLWSVAHLPDDERRPYFGPDNLWLLCREHHAAKTKREAADRAQLRRSGQPSGVEGQADLFSG
jgi:5-methylcytosine-specific restriction endonuclease McrA